MSKKWNNYQTIRFLKLYEQNPCLWNIKLKDYKDLHKRNNAYAAIAEAMHIKGFSFLDVKAKIRSVRNAYAIEKVKVIKSQKSAANGVGVYQPKLAWYKVADRLLHDVVRVNNRQPRPSPPASFERPTDPDQSIVTEDIPQINIQTEHISRNSITTPPRPTHYVSTKRAQRVDLTSKAIDDLKLISVALNANQERNEFDCFGASIACQLKKLPDIMAQKSMAHIQTFLVNQRLKSIREKEAAATPYPVDVEYETQITCNATLSDVDSDTLMCDDPIADESNDEEFKLFE